MTTKQPSVKSTSAIASPLARTARSAQSTPDLEEEDSSSADAVPTAKVPLNVVRDVRASLPSAPNNSANNSTMATVTKVSPAKRVSASASSEGEYEDEDEWETETESEVAPPAKSVRPAAVAQPNRAAGGGGTTVPVAARSETATSEEDEDEYTEEGSESEVVSSGSLWQLVSVAVCRMSFVTLVQRMFSNDSVAKSVIARDVVTLTTPTRHCLTVLRQVVRQEMSAREPFGAAGSFYQDVLYHTLVRSGASFFRAALSPTVKNLSAGTVDYELSEKVVSGAKLQQNQFEMQRLAAALFDDLFSDASKGNVPRLLRCAMWVARDEARVAGGNGETHITAFVAKHILARLLSDPTGNKMTPSVSRSALANLTRLAKIAAALVTPDDSLGPSFAAFCSKQGARLESWVVEMCKDPAGTNWRPELQPLAGLPQQERELVARFASEISTLKQWLTTGQKERAGGLTAEEKPVLELCLGLLRPLAVEGGGVSATDPIRSVRNPHRRVPNEIPLLQKEIVGLETFALDGNGRALVSQGPVVARKKNREEDGHLFLFSDILLYCKHNSADHKQLFTFSRAYRVHQVVVRMLPETERAAAAAFCVSAFAMPPHHDLTFFAANQRDRDRWVELIRKKQTDVRLATLKVARKYVANEVVKNGRKIPVELAITNDVLMKVVPQTDNVIASYDAQQLREWKLGDDEIWFDFSGAMDGQRQEDLVLRITGDNIRAIADDVRSGRLAREKTQQTQRAALPSFRPKDAQMVSARGAAPVAVVAAVAPVSPKRNEPAKKPADVPPPALPVAAQPVQQQPPTNAPQHIVKPPTTFAPANSRKGKEEDDGIGMEMERADIRLPMPIVDKRGNESDGWDVFGGSQTRPKERSEAREKRQRDKERRAQAREKGSNGRNHRLDEDKKLFMEALEQSMKQLVVEADESALRRPEELTDREIMGLQKRAYGWKRQNKLLKELLYTQYVVSQKGK